ncbi:MAG: long-chain fatty acid--CoA ligase [Desulfobacteraceae bacterium]|nr:MAG: long-chain fatty acid--CoA ligase [Desulfobacteraceae bacterium]
MKLFDLTVYDIICRNARLFPEKTAWLSVDEKSRLTFSAYKAAVDRMSAGLLTAGLPKGARIGVIGKNCLSYAVLYGAAAALGAIVVPVNWRLSADEMAYNLTDTQAGFVFADSEDGDVTAAVQSKLPASTCFFNLQAGQGAYADLPEAALPAGGTPAVDSDDGWVIIHTAAVTGRPRGALLSQRNVICANVQLMHQIGLTTADVLLNPLPLFHIAGLGMAFCCFHGGSANVLMRKFDAAQAADLIAAHKASLLFAFAPMMQNLLAHVEKTGSDIKTLRAVLGIDAPDVIERYQKLTGGSFYSLFGQTETSMAATMSPYKERPGSAGRPIPLVDIELLDDEDRPVPTGQAGEIAIRGPMVFKGYWGLDAENAHTFRNGWHHTGDMGRFDADGYLWYVARKAEKELIKPGGENVYPAEVETVILTHPAVAAVVVFGVPDPKWTEGIKAVCQLKADQTLKAQDLIDFVGARIARYKKPQYVEFVDQLPRLDNGAVDRAKVKKMYGGHR